MKSILEGKTILVAGAGGIGNGLAIRYAAEGANVVLGDIELATAQQAVDEITRAGGNAVATVLDGSDEQSIIAAVALCLDKYDGIDGLHCNFACMTDGNPTIDILGLPLETYDETMRVNARGFYLCTRAVLPHLIKRGGGAILYTSSSGANVGAPAYVSYAMSKAAGQALMRHVAVRFGAQGVRANTLAPALTLHSRIENLVPPSMTEMARAAAALKYRVGRPDDLAAMGALLMSDDGSYITGQVISIDGGTTMRP
jgi:NAD(P)-dependent dehydrogenase (short-subunit alcohol dehydrogenase family)